VEQLQVLGRPALLGDGLTGEVHHRLGLGEGLLQRRLLPAGGVGGISLEPLQLRVLHGRQRLRGTAHQGEAVARLQQLRHQGAAHKAAAPHQQNPHVLGSSSLGNARDGRCPPGRGAAPQG